MNRLKHTLQRFPVYPVLLGIYPVQFLWLNNFEQVPYFAVVTSFCIAISLSILTFLLTWIIVRNRNKAGAISGSGLFLFFIFGHIYNLIAGLEIANFDLGRYSYLSILFLLVFISLTWKTCRTKSTLDTLTGSLNLITLVMVLLLIVQIGWRMIQAEQIIIQTSKASAAHSENIKKNQQSKDRDVYYILIDRYSRSDILERAGIDQEPVIQGLKDLGFIIPDCTQSNYQGTELAMTSTFYMDYLDNLNVPIDEMKNWATSSMLYRLIHTNPVFDEFHSMGYQIITYKSSYPFIDFNDSDIYYDIDASEPFYQKIESINFQYMFMNTTPVVIINTLVRNNSEKYQWLPTMLYRFINPKDQQFGDPYFSQYKKNLFDLQKLREAPKIPGRKFFYAHLMITHKPFTFQENGNFQWPPQQDYEAYLENVKYMNTQMIPLVKTILDQYPDDNKPIIIIQGDHSSEQKADRFKIMNAYYLPGINPEKVDKYITPVNTFRLIFTEYFDKDYPLIENRTQGYDDDISLTDLVNYPPTCASSSNP